MLEDNKKLISLLQELDEEKNRLGYKQDLLTPGFLKEVMIGGYLNHYVHRTKHGPDAYSDELMKESYEYLSCKEGGQFQLDRIHENNLHRIERNDMFYFAQFYKENSIKIKYIFKVKTDVVLKEAKRKIQKMSKTSNHIGFGLSWVKDNGELVYSDITGDIK
tara:strand:+ start:590 stop:1075 length:486 start_codon:yes stop_codon:yes gene_type:complete